MLTNVGPSPGLERTRDRRGRWLRSEPEELRTSQSRTLTAGCGGLNENDLPSNRILHSFLKILESSSSCLSMAAEWAAPWSSLLEEQLPMV